MMPDEHWYSCHSSHGGTNGFAYTEAGGTESADQVILAAILPPSSCDSVVILLQVTLSFIGHSIV